MDIIRRMDSSTRILVGILVGVGVLVVLAIGLPLLSDRDDPDYPPNSVEGAVQRYVRAIIDDDVETALALLTAENTTACVEDEMRDRLRYSSNDRNRVRLGDVEERDDGTVSVTIGITTIREPGLFELPSENNTHEYDFVLERSDDGFWLIADSEWPIGLKYIRDDYCKAQPSPAPVESSG